MAKYEKRLKKRFEAVKTFPETRKHHCYIPIDGKQMKMKRISFDVDEKKQLTYNYRFSDLDFE